MKSRELLDLHRELTEKARSLMERKSNDYSSDTDALANFRSAEQLGLSPQQGLLLRVYDKLARMANDAQGKRLKAESLEDAILDIINYAVIYAALSSKPVQDCVMTNQKHIERTDPIHLFCRRLAMYDLDAIDTIKLQVVSLRRCNDRYFDAAIDTICQQLEALRHSLQPRLPRWYEVAKGEIGIKEIPGDEHNSRILEYHNATSLQATPDEIPWCSSFVNWCMRQANFHGTDSAAARSWLRWGESLDEPREGCIVVLKRGSSQWQGHVGFYVGESTDGFIDVLGGNQKNAVNISRYPASKLLDYRWMESGDER